MDETGITMEMTARSQLRPARQSLPLVIQEVSASDAVLICRLYNEIWAPLGGGGRAGWQPERWMEELSQPGIRTWILKREAKPVGFAEMEWPGNANVAIVVIGVIPSVQGRGIGGDFLTRMTRLAWQTPAPNGTPTARVWLWTRPGQHPHTIPNYLARGYCQVHDAQ